MLQHSWVTNCMYIGLHVLHATLEVYVGGNTNRLLHAITNPGVLKQLMSS